MTDERITSGARVWVCPHCGSTVGDHNCHALKPVEKGANILDEAEELASRMSYRPLTPEQSERGLNVVLGIVSALRWYDAHKRDDGSYDGELFGDLSARLSDA